SSALRLARPRRVEPTLSLAGRLASPTVRAASTPSLDMAPAIIMLTASATQLSDPIQVSGRAVSPMPPRSVRLRRLTRVIHSYSAVSLVSTGQRRVPTSASGLLHLRQSSRLVITLLPPCTLQLSAEAMASLADPPVGQLLHRVEPWPETL